MGLFAGLASLVGASLFLAWFLRRSSALMPLVAIACAMVFFSLAGIVGLLQVAGYVWYGLCAAGLVAVIAIKKKNIFDLLTPGLVFFVVASAVFIVLFLITRPMLTQWDEFTFWGTATKVTSHSNQLYTTATSSLIARSYPPGLIVHSYMMQFFGGFSEPGFISSFAVLYMACFAAAGAQWKKHRGAAVLFFAGLFVLPLFFSPGVLSGQMELTYLVCMADLPMALMFGGAICVYFAGEEKGGRLMVPFGIILAALAFVKDMGLAFAVMALFVALLDMCFCEYERMAFFRLRRWKAIVAAVVYCLLLIAGAYLVWAYHFAAATGDNRLDFGSSGQSLGPVQMVVLGVQMLFGINRSEQFSVVLREMMAAFVSRPVCLLGSGLVVLLLILALSAILWVLSSTRRQRRRVLVFTLGMAVCFVGFYIFNIFTYAIIFKGDEALGLKDYQRYISPFWMAWLMGVFVHMSRTATYHKATFYRLRVARGISGLACTCFVLAVLLLGNWQANFLRISPSLYGQRQSVKKVTQAAVDQGMKDQDHVYIISQNDDGTRFYMFGYELPAVRSKLYFGYYYNLSGELELDEADKPQYYGNAAVTLIPMDMEDPPNNPYVMKGGRQELTEYLRKEKCTHLLIDVLDEYIIREFGPMFSDHLDGWDAEDPHAQGRRYYRIEWDAKGQCSFVPAVFAQTQTAKGGEGA